MEAQKIIITGGATRIGAAIAEKLSGVNKEIVIQFNKSKSSAENLKIALASMSSGMAVALYTTLSGIVVNTLLRIQFHISSTSITALLNDLAFYTEDSIE